MLADDRGVAILQEEFGVAATGQGGYLDPGQQRAGGPVVALYLVAQLGPIQGAETQVVAIGLDRSAVGGVLQVGVGDGDQDREVGQGGLHLGIVDGDELAVLPVSVGGAGGLDPGREGQSIGQVQAAIVGYHHVVVTAIEGQTIVLDGQDPVRIVHVGQGTVIGEYRVIGQRTRCFVKGPVADETLERE